MTVVAYRDGVLASDSRCTYKDFIDDDKTKKVFRLPDKSIVGIAGNYTNGLNLLNALKLEAKKPTKKLPNGPFKGVEAILATKTMVALYMSSQWEDITKREYVSIGSGYQVAYGALEMGADAIEAVRLAIKRNCYCGGRIQHMEV